MIGSILATLSKFPVLQAVHAWAPRCKICMIGSILATLSKLQNIVQIGQVRALNEFIGHFDEAS